MTQSSAHMTITHTHLHFRIYSPQTLCPVASHSCSLHDREETYNYLYDYGREERKYTGLSFYSTLRVKSFMKVIHVCLVLNTSKAAVSRLLIVLAYVRLVVPSDGGT